MYSDDLRCAWSRKRGGGGGGGRWWLGVGVDPLGFGGADHHLFLVSKEMVERRLL